MSYLEWIATVCFSALLCWGIGKAVVQRFLTVEETLLSTFKLMLRYRDLEPERTPEAALIDIIADSISEARRMTLPESGSWRRHIVRLLDAEADVIEGVMRDGAEKHADRHTTQVLLKYGVVEPAEVPALCVEQFYDAAKRGKLYAELDERVWQREFS